MASLIGYREAGYVGFAVIVDGRVIEHPRATNGLFESEAGAAAVAAEVGGLVEPVFSLFKDES